ncbi:MAG: 2-oxoacid:acceptor oxidoreductase family protein [Candidatus Brocadiia bacterium]
MNEKLIVAGFGGQGTLFVGKLVAQAMMEAGSNVTYFPSYGAEVRGGKANCQVIISDGDIFSPVIDRADALLAMSQLSWDFFACRVKPNGLVVLNSSMADPGQEPRPQRLLSIPATDIASELGDVRATNMVMLGAYNRVRDLLPVDALVAHLRQVLTGRKARLFDLNREAIARGIQAADAAGQA